MMNEKNIKLEVGEWGWEWEEVEEVSFTGHLLAYKTEYLGSPFYEDTYGREWEVYETSQSKFAVWRRDWSRMQGAIDTATVEYCDSIDDLASIIPGELYRELLDKLEPSDEELLGWEEVNNK